MRRWKGEEEVRRCGSKRKRIRKRFQNQEEGSSLVDLMRQNRGWRFWR